MASDREVTLALECYEDQQDREVVFVRVRGDLGPLGVVQDMYLPVFPEDEALAEVGDLEMALSE